MSISYFWRGDRENDEVNALHAEAFGTRAFTSDEWDWRTLLSRHSLGWVTARDRDRGPRTHYVSYATSTNAPRPARIAHDERQSASVEPHQLRPDECVGDDEGMTTPALLGACR